MAEEKMFLDRIHGHVRVFGVDPDDVWNLLGEYDNLITYQAADILAKVLSGDNTYKIDGMFLEFENNSGTPTAISPARTDTYAGIYAGLTGSNDIMSAPLIGTPSFPVPGANYATNKVLFYSVLSGDTGSGVITSLSFDAGSNSKVKGASLVALVGNTGAQVSIKPQLFSRVSISPAVPAQTGLRLGLEWTIEMQ